MSYEGFAPQEHTFADSARADERASFIIKTYMHLLGAIVTFILLETALVRSPIAPAMMKLMTGGYSWLIVLGLFMFVSHIANKWAVNTTSIATQYMGLGLFIVAEAIIFLPLLYIAAMYGGAQVIPTAGIATLVVFTGLTGIVFFTRKNFSFLGPVLGVFGFVALGLIVCSILFGFNMGVIFPVLMIGFASAYILYDTSRVLHEYRIGQHVAASLALFASVALLFYYILSLLMRLQRD
jgi:FtsH-binding integral membrane protein